MGDAGLDEEGRKFIAQIVNATRGSPQRTHRSRKTTTWKNN